jgi:hypothetical protein
MLHMAILVVVIFCAVLCHQLARKNGKRPLLWGVMGLLFGPFAIPFVLMPGKKTADKST